MAWFLAVAADVCLTGHQRTMTFVELGCGEYHLAIERILNAAVGEPDDVVVVDIRSADPLARRVPGPSRRAARLRTMLTRIRARQCQPVPLRTRPGQGVDVGRIAACSVSVA